MGNIGGTSTLLESRSGRSVEVSTSAVARIRAVPHALAVTRIFDNLRPLLALAAKAPGAQKYQSEDTKIAQLAEDDEEKSEGLVCSARIAVHVLVDEYQLRNGEGVAGPNKRRNEEDEAGKSGLGAVLEVVSTCLCAQEG